MPNVNSNRSSSISSGCAPNGYDTILDESDTIINDLNDIIDSQASSSGRVKKNNSFKVKQTSSNNSMAMLNGQLKDFELRMPKLRSYLIKASLSQTNGFQSVDHSVLGQNYGQHATTVTGAKLTKKFLNQHLTTSSTSSQIEQHNNAAHIVSSPSSSSATCIVSNGSKKKRSSLFNLFSFKNLSRDSSMSNSQTSINNSKSANAQSNTNLTIKQVKVLLLMFECHCLKNSEI